MAKVNNSNKLKVIFCMGSGRSGSTLLGILMGSHPEIVSPGEINSVSRLPQDNFTCSCLKRVEECDYWKSIYDDWKRTEGESSLNRTFKKIRKIENFKSPLAWIQMILKYPFQPRYLKDYQDNLYSFIKAIQKQSGKNIVMDISKNPLRAYVLMNHPNIELKLIHLVRDGRGVAYSLFKPRKKNGDPYKPVWRSALFWTIVNRQSNFVRKKSKGGALLIKYEDLATNPENVIQKICNFVDIDSYMILNNLKSESPFRGDHIMAGNKLRREKRIRINLDTEWHDKLDKSEQNIFMRLAGSTMAQFGYTK